MQQLHSQAPKPRLSKSASGATLLEGKQVFGSRCAACHGLDGRGGERAPDIATGPGVQRLSDVKLARIVDAGIAGTGMPGFHSLGESTIRSVVSYLRILQGEGKSGALPGNRQKGESIFFAKGSCSECHMIGGKGGFLASDLSSYGRSRPVSEIREAMTNPGNIQKSNAKIVEAVTRSGEKFVGIVRNEDNFSLQLQTIDGSFHFLMKSELQTLKPRPEALLPPNYHAKVVGQELDDVISFLVDFAKQGKTNPVRGEVEE